MAHDTDDLRPSRDVWTAMLRGLRRRCPSCGTGRLFDGYLRVRSNCDHCGEELHHQRADDAPPYFTIMIVGHIVVGGVLALEKAFMPPEWVHLAVWLPLTLFLCLWMLPLIKGSLVGLQWALYMHGFDESWRRDEPEPIQPVAVVPASG